MAGTAGARNTKASAQGAMRLRLRVTTQVKEMAKVSAMIMVPAITMAVLVSGPLK